MVYEVPNFTVTSLLYCYTSNGVSKFSLSCLRSKIFSAELLGTNHESGPSLLAGKLFVVIGAGGAGKALAFGAKAKGARVVIANRTFRKNLYVVPFPRFSLSRNTCDESIL